jgi:hypothetical protein
MRSTQERVVELLVHHGGLRRDDRSGRVHPGDPQDPVRDPGAIGRPVGGSGGFTRSKRGGVTRDWRARRRVGAADGCEPRTVTHQPGDMGEYHKGGTG